MSRKKMKKSKQLTILSKLSLAVGVGFAVAGIMAGAIMASIVFLFVGAGLMIGGIVLSVDFEAKAEEQSIKEVKPKKQAYIVEEFENEKQNEKKNETVVVREPENVSEKNLDSLEKTL